MRDYDKALKSIAAASGWTALFLAGIIVGMVINQPENLSLARSVDEKTFENGTRITTYTLDAEYNKTSLDFLIKLGIAAGIALAAAIIGMVCDILVNSCHRCWHPRRPHFDKQDKPYSDGCQRKGCTCKAFE